MAIKEDKDLATLPLYELVGNLKVYEMILENDDVVSKTTTKDKVKSLALKAKVTRGKTSDDRTSESSSAKRIRLGAAIVLVMDHRCRIEGNFASECREPKENKAFIGGERSDSEDGNEHQNDATCLMEIDSQKNDELLRFNKDFTKTFEKLLKEKRSLENENSKLSSKINDLEIEVKKLANDKEVIEPCKNCDVLTKEVGSLKFNVSRLQHEVLNFSKFKKSSIVLDDMLSRQKLSQDNEGLGFSKNDKTTSVSPNKPMVFVKESQIGTLQKALLNP
ncbi:hypothetical protein Tco_0920622 [Tanacetum coccineum]